MRLCVATVLAFTAVSIHADSKNAADYPLRLHIFGRNQTTFWHRDNMDEAKGDGRADLYANGEAHAVDFSYECPQKVRASFGFETYPAKWKKPGRELTVLFPEFGNPGKFFTCSFKTDVKDFTYAWNKGSLISASVEDYKHWMVAHDYDPEHGKDMPKKVGPAPAEDAPAMAGHN